MESFRVGKGNDLDVWAEHMLWSGCTYGRTRMKRHWMGVLVMPLVLVSCGTAPGATVVTPGTSDRWHVSVLGARDDASIEHCFEHTLIEDAIQSADLPSTHLDIKLLKTATQEEAEQIADCLRPNVGNAKVAITSPQS